MKTRIFIIAAAVWSLISISSAEDDFKKYVRPQNRSPLLQIYFADDEINFTASGDDTTEFFLFDKKDAEKGVDEVRIKGEPVMNKDGFIIAGRNYGVDLVGRIALETDSDKETRIVLYRKDTADSRSFRSRKQNEISILDSIHIVKDRFVRGGVIAFWADIRINGEVNEDVVAVFGNISVGDNAVIRGNVISLNGNIELSKKATIYGAIRSSGGKNMRGFDRWKKWYRRDRFFSPIFKFYYNRVDGAAPYLGAGYQDEDSVLPKFAIYGGYGFASERWRFIAEVEQTLLRSLSVSVGGSYYRKLASNDDWLLSEAENTAYGLIATEDYKDYFEAEGGAGYVRVKPIPRLTTELGILSEKYKWLDGHRNLWSLFGGSKRFPDNFSTVTGESRGPAIRQIDSKELSSLNLSAIFETERPEELFESSYWRASVNIEWAPGEWNDDFLFTKYVLSATRHQDLSEQSGLVITGYYGGSDRTLPLQRKYFLGGLGTLHGYDHKEFAGSEFWLGVLEYGVRFPNSDMVGWLFYNVGQIADGPEGLGESEVRNSLGLGLAFNKDIRMLIGKRFDRADVSPRIYIRLENLFE